MRRHKSDRFLLLDWTFHTSQRENKRKKKRQKITQDLQQIQRFEFRQLFLRSGISVFPCASYAKESLPRQLLLKGYFYNKLCRHLCCKSIYTNREVLSHLPRKILTMLNVSWSRSSSSSSPMGMGSLPAVMWTGPCDLFALLPDLASPPFGFTRTNHTHHMMSQTAGSQAIQPTTSTLLLLGVVKSRALLLQLSSQDLKLFSCNVSI